MNLTINIVTKDMKKLGYMTTKNDLTNSNVLLNDPFAQTIANFTQNLGPNIETIQQTPRF